MKNLIINALTTLKAHYNEETKHFEMTEAKLEKVFENEEVMDKFKIVRSKKNNNLVAFRSKDGKTTYAIVEIKKASKKAVEPTGGHGHKTKNDGYIIIFKNKGDKKETKKTDLTSCAEIKAWMKSISKKQIEYLRIYDSANNECRKSAWIEREA